MSDRSDASGERRTSWTAGFELSPFWLILVCTVILFMRKHQFFINPQFWGEDGSLFFMGAREEGLQTFLKPYNGALYTFHRTIAYLGNWVPIRYMPHYYCYASLAATLGVILYVARSRTDIKNKSLLGIAAVACPHNGEVFLNLTNVHWVLALGLIVVLISRDPPRVWVGLLETLFVTVCCLTGPFVFFLLPLFLARACLRRSPVSVGQALVAVGCFYWQWRYLWYDRVPGAFNPHDPNWRGYFGNSLAGVLLLGQDLVAQIPNNRYLVALSALLYGFLAVYALATRSKTCGALLWAVAAVVGVVAYSHRGDIRPVSLAFAFRYFYIPFVCTTWLVILVMERSARLARPAAFVLLLIGLSSVSMFKFPLFPDYHWKQACRGIGGPKPCDIPVLPGYEGLTIHYRPK